MTGYYVRIKRDDRWQSLDIAELTDKELSEFFSRQDTGRLLNWAMALAGWIRDNVKQKEG